MYRSRLGGRCSPASSGSAARVERRRAGGVRVRLPAGIDGIGADATGCVEQSLGCSTRGASELKLQDLRHYAATAMLDAGESYRTVADILGNSESTLRLHYDGRTDVGKRKAISALELGSPSGRGS